MCTFEEIQKANESIKTMGITRNQKNKATGQYEEVTKQYAEVPQRIKAFRMIHPNGCIETEIIKETEEYCIIKARIYDANGKKLGEGTAKEEKNASQINKTSYLENCETSATGRALGMCGFGIDTSIASYEEVKNAIEQQKANEDYTKQNGQIVDTGEPITEKQLAILHKAPVEVISNIINHFGVQSLEELSKAQASETIGKILKK